MKNLIIILYPLANSEIQKGVTMNPIRFWVNRVLHPRIYRQYLEHREECMGIDYVVGDMVYNGHEVRKVEKIWYDGGVPWEVKLEGENCWYSPTLLSKRLNKGARDE